MVRSDPSPKHIEYRENILREMFKKRVEGYTDSDIIKILNLNTRTYYYYRDQLYDKIKHANLKKDDAFILAQQDILSNRLNRIFQKLLDRYERDIDTLEGDELNVLTQKLQDLAIVIFKLDVEGLRVSKFINNFVTQQTEQIQEQSNKQQQQQKGLNNRGNSEPLPRLVYNSESKTFENEQQRQKSNTRSDDRSDIKSSSTESTATGTTDTAVQQHNISRDMVKSEETF